MATKQIIFLNKVKTPYGDVEKGEILTGTEFIKNPNANPNAKQKQIPGFIFNFFEKKDPKKFLDKTIEETFFIPKSAFGAKGTIREVIPTDLIKPSDLKPKPILPVEITEKPANNPNKIVSFVLGALAGVIVTYVVLNKIGK